MKIIKKIACLVSFFPALTIAHNVLPAVHDSLSGQGLLVGYIDYTSPSQPSLLDAISHGYNMIIIGFGEVDGDEASLPLNSDYMPTLKTQIAEVKQQGTKVLLTLGGENNTFHPPAGASSADAVAIAKNLYSNVIKPYAFDGIDFDLETVSYSADFVEQIIMNLKDLDPNIIISGAPQASVWWKDDNGTLAFAPNIWNDLVASGDFTYIMLQAYNQGGGIRVYTQSGQSLGPQDPGIFAALYDLYLSQHKIPASTQLVIGEPSSPVAGNGLDDPTKIRMDIECLMTSNNCVTYAPTTHYIVPGVMTWSIGHDAENNYHFADSLANCAVNHNCQ